MRIAHFSDLHLLSLAGARTLEFANKRWIGGLNLLTSRGRHYHSHIFEAMVEDVNAQGVDHIVCTGDLTNLAFEQEFRFAFALFERLALAPGDITVVPGNHDSYVAAGLDHFRAIFAAYHESDPGWHEQDAGDHSRWPVVRVRGGVAVIGLSTSRATPWFTAYGRVGDEQLARLAAVLADPRLAGTLRLVALHHPPVGPASKSRIRGLRDRDALARVIADGGAELIVHGHEHRDLRMSMPGPGERAIDVLGVQSGTYLAHRPERTARYRIFDIAHPSAPDATENREPPARPVVGAHRLRVWDSAAGQFIDDPDDAPAAFAHQHASA